MHAWQAMPRILAWEDVGLEFWLIWKRQRVGEGNTGCMEKGGDKSEEMEHEEEEMGEEREEEMGEKKPESIQEEQ